MSWVARVTALMERKPGLFEPAVAALVLEPAAARAGLVASHLVAVGDPAVAGGGRRSPGPRPGARPAGCRRPRRPRRPRPRPPGRRRRCRPVRPPAGPPAPAAAGAGSGRA